MSELILTRKQNDTVSRLKSSSWGEIKPLDISLLLPKLLDSKKESEILIPKIIDYEKIKNPTKSIDWIVKVLDKKIKSSDDKKVFEEVIKMGDYSSFPSIDKPTKKTGKKNNLKIPTNDLSKFLNTTTVKKSGTDQQLNDKLDSILKSNREQSGIQETPAFQGPGTKLGDVDKVDNSIDFSTLFKTGSKAYTDNKALIDGFKKNLTKEKLADGSWLTGLASLSYPEIQIMQDVINMTPLGLSSKDKSNLENLLSKDKSKNSSVSTSDGIKIILKSLINPDSIGTILKTRGDQITADGAEGLDKWWRKATGAAPKKDENLGALEDIIGGRIKTENDKNKRQQDLDLLKGKKTEVKPVIPVKEVDKGIVGLKPIMDKGITGGKFKPVGDIDNQDKNQLSIADILKPPDVPGMQETTAGQDAFGFLKGIFVPNFGLGDKRNTPEGALEWLKTNNPEIYSEYNKKKFDYDKTVKKAGMSINSEVDMMYHKEEVLRAREFTRDLLKKASDLKELTDQEIEDIYDISETLESVLKGDSKITYKDLDDLTLGVINMIPEGILQAGNILGNFTDSQLKGLKPSFKGDSNLTNFDSSLKQGKGRTVKITKDPYKDPKDKDPNDKDGNPKDPKKEITETTLDKKESSKSDTDDTSWSDLRPRMKWGGTDEMFIRSEDNVNIGNLVAAARGIEEEGWTNGNADENILFKRTLKTDSMRYNPNGTNPMPNTERYFKKYSFKKDKKFFRNGKYIPQPIFNNNSYFGQTNKIDSNDPLYFQNPKKDYGLLRQAYHPTIFRPVDMQAGIQRNFYDVSYNPHSFYQFLDFTPAYAQHSSTQEKANQLSQFAYYPDNRNLYNLGPNERGQGEGNANLSAVKNNYIQNQRFIK